MSTEVVDSLEKNLENLLESTQQDLNNLHSQLSGTDSVKSECQTCQENHIVTNKRLEDLRIQVTIKMCDFDLSKLHLKFK